MKKLSKIIKGGVLAMLLAVIISAPIYATLSKCVGKDNKYPNLSLKQDKTYTVKCTRVKDEKGKYQTLYGKTQADCAQAGTIAADLNTTCEGDDLNNIVTIIINTVIFVIGMVAVVMIILGGISYATSQGDAGKVKKGKDTILYGIIGLVIAILAFAIVNFVLGALAN
ncbi:hypothetical protein IK110_03020 [Candidatus Saccharibacteria bacterium]|nr:hypothetical protein [Candidatus Saccharibacteria bacterium]